MANPPANDVGGVALPLPLGMTKKLDVLAGGQHPPASRFLVTLFAMR